MMVPMATPTRTLQMVSVKQQLIKVTAIIVIAQMDEFLETMC